MTEANRPPLPPFSRETAIEKVRLAEDGWNSRTPKRLLWHIPSTVNGATGQNSSMAATPSLPFLQRSGGASSITG